MVGRAGDHEGEGERCGGTAQEEGDEEEVHEELRGVNVFVLQGLSDVDHDVLLETVGLRLFPCRWFKYGTAGEAVQALDEEVLK